MLGLIPTENWEYRLADVIRGFVAGFHSNPGGMLDIPGIGSCVPARSGRAALIAAIQALQLRPGAPIAVPLYCCPVVFKAVLASGCVPRFIDVGRATLCMSPDDLYTKRSQVEAVIAVHMFGHVCDMPRLQDAADGRPIIEDCAQSLGSTLNGRMTGSLGRIAVFSFRSGKYLSVGEGGALFSPDEGVLSRLKQRIADMSAPGALDEWKHVTVTYLRTLLRTRPLYGPAGYPIWKFYNKTVDYTAKSPIVLTQIYNSDRVITLKRLPHLNSIMEKQRQNAEFYSRSLKVDPEMLSHEQPGTFYNRYQYPMIFPSAKIRDSVAVYLFEKKIDAGRPYQDIAKIAAEHYGYSGDCPVAERISMGVLTIPSYYRLKKSEMERIADYVNAGWAGVLPGGAANFKRNHPGKQAGVSRVSAE